jgi:hypothetical protein
MLNNEAMNRLLLACPGREGDQVRRASRVTHQPS